MVGGGRHQFRSAIRVGISGDTLGRIRAPAGVRKRGGGGGTDSLRLGTNCETTAPLFDKGQPPLCMDAQEQPLEISIKWEFALLHMSYFSKLLY